MDKIKAALKWTAMMVIMGSTQTLNAATLVESLNNTVANGTIITLNPAGSDWSSVQGYVIDPNENSSVDWHQVFIANDSEYLYVRYVMNASSMLDGSFRLMLDTDLNRSTGYIGGEGQLSVGAEFMIEGATVYGFTGGESQTLWSWGSGTLQDYAGSDNVYQFSISLAALGTDTFNFMLFADGDISGVGAYRDYYTDNAGLGDSGGYMQYSTVPEPGTVLLLGLGIGAVLLYRKRRA